MSLYFGKTLSAMIKLTNVYATENISPEQRHPVNILLQLEILKLILQNFKKVQR